jgi:HSP20 family protein
MEAERIICSITIKKLSYSITEEVFQMTTLIRWNPMREMMSLRNEMNRLFERALDEGSLSPWQPTTSWGLAVDVSENEEAFLVTASVPGMDPDDLDITVTDNVLTIKGEYKADGTIEEEKYHIRERRYGSFARSISLPVSIDADAVAADYKDGVLSLTVPKAEETKARRITVKTHNNGQ